MSAVKEFEGYAREWHPFVIHVHHTRTDRLQVLCPYVEGLARSRDLHRVEIAGWLVIGCTSSTKHQFADFDVGHWGGANRPQISLRSTTYCRPLGVSPQ
jgi:hypothetical protein